MRIFNQSGIGGMVQSMLSVGTGEPTALMSPLVRTAGAVTLKSDSVSESIYHARAAYGANIPVIGPAITTALSHVFPDSIGEHFKASQLFISRKLGTDPLPGLGL